jgi:hypothetical protein
MGVMIMRALSVQQPFAEMIIAGKKKREYRSIATNIRERVYIYASRTAGPKERWIDNGYEEGSLPVGVLVGTVEVVGCSGEAGDYAWSLAHPERAKKLVKPKNRPQPVWFLPF